MSLTVVSWTCESSSAAPWRSIASTLAVSRASSTPIFSHRAVTSNTSSRSWCARSTTTATNTDSHTPSHTRPAPPRLRRLS
eukprot:26491_6